MSGRERCCSIGLTLGDAGGVGPELVLRALSDAAVRRAIRPVVYGNAALLRQVARAAGIPWPHALHVVAAGQPLPTAAGATEAVLFDFPAGNTRWRPGVVSAAHGRQACRWIAAAARDALAGRLDAIVTAPVCKAALHAAACPHPGHTELLAALTGAPAGTMFFWSPRLKVGLVTIHVALARVPRLITRERVLATILRVAAACRTPRRPHPRLAVLALNPHAGENGLFGREECDAIAPAIAAAAAAGLQVEGPLVPDTAFLAARRRRTDGYIAMYHDQGLLPFKLLAFDRGVNATLGLPIVRTSPDHGTAFDIAWRGIASPNSLIAAIACARRLALVRRIGVR